MPAIILELEDKFFLHLRGTGRNSELARHDAYLLSHERRDVVTRTTRRHLTRAAVEHRVRQLQRLAVGDGVLRREREQNHGDHAPPEQLGLPCMQLLVGGIVVFFGLRLFQMKSQRS